MQASHHVLGSLKHLSCIVLGCHLGSGGHLDEKDNDEYIEYSDYENDVEKADEPVSQKIERNSEQKDEQKLFSVLKFGSSVA
jgi:hypothetical protein